MRVNCSRGLQPRDDCVEVFVGVEGVLVEVVVVGIDRGDGKVQRAGNPLPLGDAHPDEDEFAILRSHFATTSWNKRRSLPYAFTELGVSMLSSVLTTETDLN